MNTYVADCRRSGDWWAVSVPEIKGLHTQAQRLDQVEGLVREAIALMLDVEPDSFEVIVDERTPFDFDPYCATGECTERSRFAVVPVDHDDMTVRICGDHLLKMVEYWLTRRKAAAVQIVTLDWTIVPVTKVQPEHAAALQALAESRDAVPDSRS